MAAPNPYQSPTAADEPSEFVTASNDAWLGQPGVRTRFLVTSVILGGSEFFVFVLALGILAYSIVESGPLFATSGGPTLLTAMGLFSLAKTFALPIWAAMPGPQRRFAIGTALLHPIAVIAVSVFCLHVMRGSFLPQRLEMFGASAFAMLMTSQTLLALALRAIAVAQQIPFLRVTCGLVVVGYALSAAACSMNVLGAVPRYNDTLVLASMGTGMLGQLLQILAFFHFFNWLRGTELASPEANENSVDQ